MTDLAVSQIPVPVSVPIVPQHRSARVVYSDQPSDFRKLVWRGALLELITAGFYRFWLATYMRRHLWSHTSVEGDTLEYTGVAKELLIGFLIALAILVPIYLAYFLLGIEAERYQAFASVPLFLFLYAFFQFAIFRARRYRASRTIWRGVRFWMTGSGWLYSLRSCLWGVLVLITLGIAYPWREAALERYKMNHTHYGDLPGRFEGTGWGLFKKVWWMGILILPIITFPFIYPAYKAASWQWWVAGARIGEVRFESSLRTGGLMGVYWACFGFVMLISTIGAGIIGALGSAVAYLIAGPDFDAAQMEDLVTTHVYAVYAFFILSYLFMALAIGAFMRIYLVRGVWEKIANSSTVHNLEAADNVMAKGGAANALGEGFTNDLDIGGF
ncbi:MAG TPA: DUF898 family protein [Xanthobacteraceae bacterium]|jgi:uncharacterized membrane protein YjgN (DUF898 family)|nr:DUF898 family protein [Xanthobacteraceae bacterium]